jgi:GAF domain-containing protein
VGPHVSRMEGPWILYVAAADGPEPPPALTERTPFETVRAETAAAAVARVERGSPDCVVTAQQLPDDTGTSLAASLRAVDPTVGVVLYAETGRERAMDVDTHVEFVDVTAEGAAERLARLVETVARTRCHAPYPTAPDERERIVTTERLSQERWASLDRLAELAGLHFGTEYAAVNLVGNREVTAVGRYGDPPISVPREESACTYTVLHDDPTVVPDLDDDPRFERYDPGDLGLRFYAGTRVLVDGHPVGTVCVYDAEAGTAPEDGGRFLAVLSAAAGEHLSTAEAPTAGTTSSRGRSE